MAFAYTCPKVVVFVLLGCASRKAGNEDFSRSTTLFLVGWGETDLAADKDSGSLDALCHSFALQGPCVLRSQAARCTREGLFLLAVKHSKTEEVRHVLLQHRDHVVVHGFSERIVLETGRSLVKLA